jgi:hypothetical protein
LGIITEGGGLAILFRDEAHSFVCFASGRELEESWKSWKRVELKNYQTRLSHLQRMTCLVITGGMRSSPMSALEVMLMLPPLHLFIKQEARQAANRLLRNECSYVPNFGHSEVLIKMTDKMPLLLAPWVKFVTLNIFGS